VIVYLFLLAGAAGTEAAAYYALRGRGVHRYVAPRPMLRLEAANSTAVADELACKLIGLASEYDAVAAERDALKAALEKAGLRIADQEEQLRAFDLLCAENTQLRADLANARAMRQLTAGPRPADDASALPDDVQEFVDQTATTWRAEVL